jgi:predicted dehydrogenase
VDVVARGSAPGVKTARVLIIGGGAIAEQLHLPAAVRLLGSERVLLAEPDTERRARLVTRFDCRRHSSDYRELIDKADFAVVATPPHLHATIAEDCLAAGLPVLCEKPLANSTHECRAMIDAARRAGQLLGTCHQRRFFPNRAAVRERILAGEFGDGMRIDISEGTPSDWPSRSGYAFRKELIPGGVLLNSGIHSLDFMLWCLGDPIELEYRDDSIGGLESNGEVSVRFANGCQGHLRISRTCQLSNTITVTGPRASIHMNIFQFDRLIDTDGREQLVRSADDSAITNWAGLGVKQLTDFIEAIPGSHPPRCDGEAGLRVIDLVERCYSVKRNRPLPKTAPVPGRMW